MANYVMFSDGATYGASDLARYTEMLLGDSGSAHLLASSSTFLLGTDQDARTVRVNSGTGFIKRAKGGYAAVQTTTTTTLNVPQASTANPRRDLVVVRLLDVEEGDATNGLAIELIQGTPAATPAAPARPLRSIALGWLDVPKSGTTFSLTTVRHTGQYRDQLVSPAPGTFGVDWGGQLPAAAGFRPGAILIDHGTNQRYLRTKDGSWFTADPGPWQRCTLTNFTSKTGTNVTVGGELWARESSVDWEFSGQLDLSPAVDPEQLVAVATTPTALTRPRANTYGNVGQSYSLASRGMGRFGYMTTGKIEFGSGGVVGNVYINESVSKSPFNS